MAKVIPLILEAIKFTGDNLEELQEFAGPDAVFTEIEGRNYYAIECPRLTLVLWKNDYLVRKAGGWLDTMDPRHLIYSYAFEGDINE